MSAVAGEEPVVAADGEGPDLDELARTVEALLFVSPEPVPGKALMEACDCTGEELDGALGLLRETYRPGRRGMELKEVAGGLTFATAPEAEDAARRLLAKPRTPPLTPAQAETLSIVAYLQPVSRPEITRIRGVSADSASGTLLERGLIEEAGRSQFGAILYRTTPLFLKLFGLASIKDLPDVSAWDPTPEEAADLRDRLLRAGEARAGIAPAPSQPPSVVVDGAPDDDGEPDAGEAPVAPTPLRPPAPAPVPPGPAPFGGVRLVPPPADDPDD
ncbi:SMC-Scp complex subunit ScpB [Paraconexibacter antarcticus]|uniref:SMC-Scp complex subunit ScpB n=1 Tax=Paraconexibacter antarcticus TaxID=2949664 RepID=A0ABY5DQW3_9ACTN|nr:SMC-Scp complex subunit ScpB [Paraconexibacter antarcticus]UTI63147.1 SMC-Scp complex subunit ScpB [Paraconexibacter antarcticus]